MNYKYQIHFLNDVTMWRAHLPALINMNIIKSPFLHQCRLYSNNNSFKIVQKDFIKSSRIISLWLHMSTLLSKTQSKQKLRTRIVFTFQKSILELLIQGRYSTNLKHSSHARRTLYQSQKH